MLTTPATILKSYIGGEFCLLEQGPSSPSVNPTHPSDTVAQVPCGSGEEVLRATNVAAEAGASWASLSGPQRAEHLYRWAEAIQARSSEMAEAVVREVGKPIGEARGEVARCVAILRYYAGEAVRSHGEVIPAQAASHVQYSLHVPLGVVALITPWNFPVAIPLWKAAPALAFGNTVVLKPAEQASYCALLLAETAHAAGMPPGTFNVLFGKGSVIGDALLTAPEVRAVSFTGSDSTGMRIAKTAAARNIRYQTEMGGKNVGIVLGDADLKQAAALVAGGAMRFAGQKCTATSRAVVVRSVKEAFLAELSAAVEALPVGDPAELATAVGPVISAQAQEGLEAAIASAAGRKVLQGLPSGLPDGYFVGPTVLADVPIDSEVAQEELFGPVLAVIDAEDFDDAIELANQTRFGLSASLFTRDLSSALAYCRRIEAGLVRVNGDTTGVDPHAPFGGVKGSSSGTREQGSAAREFYTEIKTVQIGP